MTRVIFPAKFRSPGCINHCIVGGNHGVDALIPQTDEWWEFPTYCCLKVQARKVQFKIEELRILKVYAFTFKHESMHKPTIDYFISERDKL